MGDLIFDDPPLVSGRQAGLPVFLVTTELLTAYQGVLGIRQKLLNVLRQLFRVELLILVVDVGLPDNCSNLEGCKGLEFVDNLTSRGHHLALSAWSEH